MRLEYDAQVRFIQNENLNLLLGKVCVLHNFI